jgi:hypothetical protein
MQWQQNAISVVEAQLAALPPEPSKLPSITTKQGINSSGLLLLLISRLRIIETTLCTATFARCPLVMSAAALSRSSVMVQSSRSHIFYGQGNCRQGAVKRADFIVTIWLSFMFLAGCC